MRLAQGHADGSTRLGSLFSTRKTERSPLTLPLPGRPPLWGVLLRFPPQRVSSAWQSWFLLLSLPCLDSGQDVCFTSRHEDWSLYLAGMCQISSAITLWNNDSLGGEVQVSSVCPFPWCKFSQHRQASLNRVGKRCWLPIVSAGSSTYCQYPAGPQKSCCSGESAWHPHPSPTVMV